MSDTYRESREFYASIAAVLLAGDIKATVVENTSHHFVKVHLISGGAVLWGVSQPEVEGQVEVEGTWVWTALSPDGVLTPGATDWPSDTEVGQVAKNIATFAYGEALDFPMEHPSDLELDFTQPIG